MIKVESQKLYFSSAFGFYLFFLFFDDKESQSWKASQKPKAKSQNPKNFECKELKAEKNGHEKVESRKFYHRW